MPMIDMAATGRNIKKFREEHGMTLKDMQKTCGGVSMAAVCKWQKGQNIPSIDNLVALADAWDVKIDDILIIRKAA